MTDLANGEPPTHSPQVADVLSDSRITLIRAADRILQQSHDPLGTGQEFNAILDGCQPGVRGILQVVREDHKVIRAATLTLFLRQVLVDWETAHPDAVSSLLLVVDQVDVEDADREAVADLVWAAFRFLSLADAPEHSGSIDTSAARFRRLASTLQVRGDLAEALACAMTASNVSMLGLLLDEKHTDHYDGLRAAAAVGVPLAVAQNTTADQAVLMARNALAVVAATSSDLASIESAYDAVEAALRIAYLEPDSARGAVQTLLPVLDSYGFLRPLHSMVSGVEGLVTPSDGEMVLRPVWELSAGELAEKVTFVGSVAIAIENHRLGFLPPERPFVEAEWATHGFDYGAFRASVPMSTSILRDPDRDEQMMILRHEITHIECMQGILGLNLYALRSAAHYCEIDLGTQLYGAEVVALDNPQPFELEVDPSDAIARVRVMGLLERQLELSRKSQILQEVWRPWLEGVALFAELSAHPTDDAEAHTLSGAILANLVDRMQRAQGEEEIAEVFDAHRQMVERAFTEAVESSGYHRLRQYLDLHHSSYLPGYLLVRAVVAAWRKSTGVALPGARALRLLLHATTWSVAGRFPDLSLPLDQFQESCRRGFLDWVDAIGQLRAADIDWFFAQPIDPPTPITWIDDRPSPYVQAPVAWQAEFFELAHQARMSLCDPTDVDRVPGASADCREFLRTCAGHFRDSIESETQRKQADSIALSMISIQRIRHQLLLLGTCRSPFWLNHTNQTLYCLIRTTERAAHHRPSYGMLGVPLRLKSAERLVHAIHATGSGRMQVYRVADLRPQSGGLNFYVFQLGDWIDSLPAGQLLGAAGDSFDLAKEVEAKFTPPHFVAQESELAGNPLEIARRCLAFLESHATDEDLQPWLDRITRLAKDVASRHDTGLRHQLALDCLSRIHDNHDWCEQMTSKGVRHLLGPSPAGLSDLMRTLQQTGRCPSDDPKLVAWMEGQRGTLDYVFRRGPIGWDIKPLNQKKP